MKDPFVAEVRKHRMDHTQQFKSDLHLICEDLRAFELTLGKRLVTLKTKRRRPSTRFSPPRACGG
ncbi:MAG: hypothetical protein A3K18_21145 [Lentisphaerae bacterium RIFOXYA12_64_32]|nr:MAG: hypothetical protein A3K18_21145 [Lentisphaerae bacterium RIFOXYA12_64_32]